MIVWVLPSWYSTHTTNDYGKRMVRFPEDELDIPCAVVIHHEGTLASVVHALTLSTTASSVNLMVSAWSKSFI